MSNDPGLISYYIEHRFEIDLLADTEALFVLSFSEHISAMSTQQLAHELQWTHQEVLRVCGRLVELNALEIREGDNSCAIQITPVGKRAIATFQSVVVQPQAQAALQQAQKLFRTGFERARAGALESAARAYRDVLKLEPRFEKALLNLGTVYFEKHDYRTAEAYYRAALEIKPVYAMAHFNLACVYHEKRNSSMAQLHYLRALSGQQPYPDAHYNLAVLYYETNRRHEAVEHWRYYLDFDASSRWADIAREQLRSDPYKLFSRKTAQVETEQKAESRGVRN